MLICYTNCMLIIVHIILALISLPAMLLAIVNEKFDFIASRQLLPGIASYSFAGIITTGFALVLLQHGSMMDLCVSGLTYLAALSVAYGALRYYRSIRSQNEI